eukprot:Skav211915  [mRNA]  locus=scaffold1200:36549:37863:- [translate_table: standard]
MAALRALLLLGSALVVLACTDAATAYNGDALAAAVMIVSIISIVFGLLTIILMSLPLCCGVLKKWGKAIGAVGIVLGIVTCVIPFLGSMGACPALVSAVCDDRCDDLVCTDEQRDDILTGCNAAGAIFVYLFAFGWVGLILGIVGASLACCVCCQCCKAKLDGPVVVQQAAPPVVVGTAAPA